MNRQPEPQDDQNKQPLTLVVAISGNDIIGDQGRIPWNLPEDLRLFRQLTLGGTLIMGRKTFESLPAPLNGRHNLVVGATSLRPTEAEFFSSLEQALTRAQELGKPIFIIGGAKVYQASLHLCSHMIISWVEGETSGDTCFPAVDWSQWTLVKEEPHDGFRRCIYQRRRLLS